MKRALTLALTVALIGSLTFMGFAGTAAAANFENDASVDQKANAATDQAEDLDQSNEQDAENDQEQEAEQANEADQGDNVAFSGYGHALAFNNAHQKNKLYQKQKAKNYQKNEPKAFQHQDADADAKSVAVPITPAHKFVNAAL